MLALAALPLKCPNIKKPFSSFINLSMVMQSLVKSGRCQAPEYVYGEIEFESFLALVGLTRPTADTVFYDLGSGAGKAVLACAMVYNMAYYAGIELFESLHACATAQQESLKKNQHYLANAQKVQFIHGDFLAIPWPHATLVFIHSTMFSAFWDTLNAKFSLLKPGAWVIVISTKLSHPMFQLYRQTKVLMSWGVATAYVYCKRQ